ncbi:MAG: FAD:protein transferase [Solirubrobacteraceae bacterium]|jgi:thiamine biosynthesis lipoprotein|nr:FAD:protein transferase [Solirubrobacteraceae bacterium]
MATAVVDRRPRDPLTARWEALGTSVVVQVTQADALEAVIRIVDAELRAIDNAASRFRPDSELERLNAAGGRRLLVSPLLLDALAAAIRAAELTDGAVDPTLGDALVLAGYDRDWRQLDPPADPPAGPQATAPWGSGTDADTRAGRALRPLLLTVRRARSWELIELERDPPAARLPGGIRVDLGATAKALAADRAADAAAREARVGVLVSLGGDIATAGRAPDAGWLVHVTDDHRSPPTGDPAPAQAPAPGAARAPAPAPAPAPGQTIAISSGGLATSSTTVRRWNHAGRTMHHILDPRDGRPVDRAWRTASVAAASCLDANIASTAAIVIGSAAAAWLAERSLPARLVGHDGCVETVGAWPAGEASGR